mgnify:CR=1 FL=1
MSVLSKNPIFLASYSCSTDSVSIEHLRCNFSLSELNMYIYNIKIKISWHTLTSLSVSPFLSGSEAVSVRQLEQSVCQKLKQEIKS